MTRTRARWRASWPCPRLHGTCLRARQEDEVRSLRLGASTRKSTTMTRMRRMRSRTPTLPCSIHLCQATQKVSRRVSRSSHPMKPSLTLLSFLTSSFVDGDESVNLTSYAASATAAAQVVNANNGSSAPPSSRPRQHKPRWHFGIRSRSPPMEVMLEIYRTLKALGMEWRMKTDLPDGTGADGKDNGESAKGKKEEQERGLFFVETRCRVRDVVVSLVSLALSDFACLR